MNFKNKKSAGCLDSHNLSRIIELQCMEDLVLILIKIISSTMWQLLEECHFLSNFWNLKTKCNMLELFSFHSFSKFKLMDTYIILTLGQEFSDILRATLIGVNFLLKTTMKILIDHILPNITLNMETDWKLYGRTDQTDLLKKFIHIQLKKERLRKRSKNQRK